MTIAAGSRILGEASPVFAFGWERGRAKKKCAGTLWVVMAVSDDKLASSEHRDQISVP
jgi:hypothetical protein